MRKLPLSRIVLALLSVALLGPGCASSEMPGSEPPTSAVPANDRANPTTGADPVLIGDGEDVAADGACAALAADACAATEGCQVVRGARLMALPAAQGATPAHCLQPRSDIACIPAQMCAAAITYFCNDKGDVYEVGSACGPAGWKPCATPLQVQGDCAP